MSKKSSSTSKSLKNGMWMLLLFPLWFVVVMLLPLWLPLIILGFVFLVLFQISQYLLRPTIRRYRLHKQKRILSFEEYCSRRRREGGTTIATYKCGCFYTLWWSPENLPARFSQTQDSCIPLHLINESVDFLCFVLDLIQADGETILAIANIKHGDPSLIDFEKSLPESFARNYIDMTNEQALLFTEEMETRVLNDAQGTSIVSDPINNEISKPKSV